MNSKEKQKEYLRIANDKRKSRGYFKEYYRKNPKLFKRYRSFKGNKDHEITLEEWETCKKYFNYSCAYCGKSEDEVLRICGQKLHKEHAINYGTNDISNCVPACRNCNSKKWTNNYTNWYIEGNPVYSKVRFDIIIKWLKIVNKK